MHLTTNILIKNNEETIEHTLKSAREVSQEIIAGNIGSTDGTVKICKSYGAKVIDVPFNDDLSASKNHMLKLSKSWIMFLEPDEMVVSYPNNLFELFSKTETAYRVKVIKNDLITKELRIWHSSNKVKFKNPVFETPKEPSIVKNIDLFLTSRNICFNEEKMNLLEKWKINSPMSSENLYYTSCANLIQKEWRNFINSAETYLYREPYNNITSTMTRYYLAMVKTYVKTEIDYKEAIKNILWCISERPLMAEFWCLLGDIHCNLGESSKAKTFYHNAIILGSRRENDDEWPVEISKYKEYPSKMLKACENIENNTKVFKHQ